MKYHVAQVNIGRIQAPLEDPVMAGFVGRLAEINALADNCPGFVWRLQTSEGDATYLRPYDDDRILVNMSVWESVEALKHFAYRTTHAELLRQRQDWFEKFVGSYVALWWVPIGHVPALTRRRSAWHISTSTDRRSSPSPSRRSLRQMRIFSGELTGHHLSRVRCSASILRQPDLRQA